MPSICREFDLRNLERGTLFELFQIWTALKGVRAS
jgi:hypothetical protein